MENKYIGEKIDMNKRRDIQKNTHQKKKESNTWRHKARG